jgi:hypothetical protein
MFDKQSLFCSMPAFDWQSCGEAALLVVVFVALSSTAVVRRRVMHRHTRKSRSKFGLITFPFLHFPERPYDTSKLEQLLVGPPGPGVCNSLPGSSKLSFHHAGRTNALAPTHPFVGKSYTPTFILSNCKFKCRATVQIFDLMLSAKNTHSQHFVENGHLHVSVASLPCQYIDVLPRVCAVHVLEIANQT